MWGILENICHFFNESQECVFVYIHHLSITGLLTYRSSQWANIYSKLIINTLEQCKQTLFVSVVFVNVDQTLAYLADIYSICLKSTMVIPEQCVKYVQS